MTLSPKIRLAIKIASRQHKDQMRRDGITPFIIHPIEVAAIVGEYTDDENIISAAWLHDVLEDTSGYTNADMKNDFGDEVTELVLSLTDEELPNLDWNEKHKIYLDKLKKASDGAVLICLADKYANVSAQKVNQERVWYYREIIKIAKDREMTKGIKLLEEFEKLVESTTT